MPDKNLSLVNHMYQVTSDSNEERLSSQSLPSMTIESILSFSFPLEETYQHHLTTVCFKTHVALCFIITVPN